MPKLTHIHTSLMPLAWLYALGVRVRNYMFDTGIIESRTYPLPIISIGNITAGGTGKTPHVEYLIRLLSPHYSTAVLSRGYKRKTSGYRRATPTSTPEDIGDEPWQIANKYPDTIVAVDADRRHGIEQLTMPTASRGIQVILLDDAYQHRYVKPGLNILLVNYHRLITHDHLLPAGRLREPVKSKNRADIIIVTKCPANITTRKRHEIAQELRPDATQQLYFSSYTYGTLRNAHSRKEATLSQMSSIEILLVAGIGNPHQFVDDMQQHLSQFTTLIYADHHNFDTDDINHIRHTLHTLSPGAQIITTEKDAARLATSPGMDDQLKEHIWILPIEVRFIGDTDKEFNQTIKQYVQENLRNSSMAQRADAHTA